MQGKRRGPWAVLDDFDGGVEECGDDIHKHNDDEGEDLVTVATVEASHLKTEAVTDDDVEEGGV